VLAARFCNGSASLKDVETEVRRTITDREPSNVVQYGLLVLKWQAVSREPNSEVAEWLVGPLITAVEQGQHSELPLLLDVLTQIAEAASHSWLERVLERLTYSLMVLLEECDYEGTYDGGRIYSLAECLEVRHSAARLMRVARQREIDNEAVREWLAAIQRDAFADVRRLGTVPA